MRTWIILPAALFLLAQAGLSQAAVIRSFTDEAVFTAQLPPTSIVTLGLGGAAPNITVNGAASSASAGALTIVASSGKLFGDGSVVSTETERTTLVLTFAKPILSIGFFPLITDDLFGSLLGQLSVALVGSDTATLAVVAGAPRFIGYESDVAFSTLRLSVLSSDPDANSTAFATLASRVELGRSPVDVPAPGPAALLAPMLFWLGRRRAGSGNTTP